MHSLSRYIDGHSAKKIRAKLASLSPDELPDVEEAKLSIDRQDQAQALQRPEQRQHTDKGYGLRGDPRNDGGPGKDG